MHHPRGGSKRFVTISAGVASLVPPRELPLESLLKACKAALKRAKTRGKDGVSTAESSDFH
jgi:PleD family two-component response regulator